MVPRPQNKRASKQNFLLKVGGANKSRRSLVDSEYFDPGLDYVKYCECAHVAFL